MFNGSDRRGTLTRGLFGVAPNDCDLGTALRGDLYFNQLRAASSNHQPIAITTSCELGGYILEERMT